MKEKVLKTIKDNKLIENKDKIAVGLSGGADSVVLLHILNELKKELAFEIVAVHVNHMIRGNEALRDETFSADYCKALGVEIEIVHKNCVEYARLHKLGMEESARILRYEAFREVCRAKECNKIAVAHNLNDNVETMLMRMLRGTSAYGLRGIDTKSGNIIRPLIECTRDEIEAFAVSAGLSYVNDSTNEDEAFTRNKIRGELLPLLQNGYNPNILQTLSRLSKSLKNDAAYFDLAVNEAYEKYARFNCGSVTILKEAFEKEHISVIERLIRLSVEKLAGNAKDFDSVHTNMVVKLRNMDSGKKVNLTKGLCAANSFGNVIIYKAGGSNNEEIKLESGSFIKLESGEYLSISDKWQEAKAGFEILERHEILCDGDLVLRKRKNGDFLINSNGKKLKLKDFFVNRKIPVFLRDETQVIACKNQVFMIFSDINHKACGESCGRRLFIDLWREING